MILRYISILSLALSLPVFVFAQDGSAGSVPEPSAIPTQDNQARATTSEQAAPSAGTTDPRPTPTPTAPPASPSQGGQATPAPVPTPTTIPSSTTEPEHQETNSNLPEILVMSAALLFGGLGLYKLATKQSVQNRSDDKKNKNRCFNIKKMMEDKLKELTDLRGQLETKAKRMAREKFKEAIAGTEAAKIIDAVEAAEKEYNRLKKLFEQCELELDAEKIKTLKFDESLVDLILTGKKEDTWRLLDDKKLSKGDDLELIDKQSGKTFAKAVITEIEEKKFSFLAETDAKKRELRKYYGENIPKDSQLKIVHFKLKK